MINTRTVPVPVQGDGPIVNTADMQGSLTVQVSGPYRGRYKLLASQDDQRFIAIAQFNSGSQTETKMTVAGTFKSVRLRSAVTMANDVECSISGLNTSLNGFGIVASLPSGFSGSSVPVDTANFVSPSGSELNTCLLCHGGFSGILVVEGSLNGTAWNPIGEWQQDNVPPSEASGIDFDPLVIPTLTRYLRLTVEGVTTSTVVVTFGGSRPTTGGDVGATGATGVGGGIGSTGATGAGIVGATGATGTGSVGATGASGAAGSVGTTFNPEPCPAFVAGAATWTPSTNRCSECVIETSRALPQNSVLTISTAGLLEGSYVVTCRSLALGYPLTIAWSGGDLAVIPANLTVPRSIILYFDGLTMTFSGAEWVKLS